MLEAGAKSSPVVRDPALDTGDPSTIYLFNMKRGAILEYRVAIAENLLRELTRDEKHLVADLEEAYNRARERFVPRRKSSPRPTTRVRRAVKEPEIPDDVELENEVPVPPILDDESGDGLDSAEL
jgi:hypothetical protein